MSRHTRQATTPKEWHRWKLAETSGRYFSGTGPDVWCQPMAGFEGNGRCISRFMEQIDYASIVLSRTKFNYGPHLGTYV